MTKENVENSKRDLYLDENSKFKKGNPGGGRPKGSVSIITKVKQIFEENPEYLEEWVHEYMKDPNNRKHLTEMVDGKPGQQIDITSGGEPIPILGGISRKDDDSS